MLVALAVTFSIVHLRCYIENPSIVDTYSRVWISLVVVPEIAIHCGIEVDKQNAWREPGSVFSMK